MGLLTSDSSQKTSVLATLLTHHWAKLSVLSYLSGLVVSVFLLTQSDRTYFSDNALLPGLVQREFTLSQFADQTLEALNKVSEQLPEDEIPYSWLSSELRQLGLEVYSHNFTLNYPFGSKVVFILFDYIFLKLNDLNPTLIQIVRSIGRICGDHAVEYLYKYNNCPAGN